MIKIEFSGTGDEVRSEMMKLLGLHEPEKLEESKVEPEKQQVADIKPKSVRVSSPRKKKRDVPASSVTWTEEETKELFDRVSANARRILLEMAQKPEGYKIKDLAESLGTQEKSIKGQLSSVGKTLKKMGGKPSPISREKIDGALIYNLDPAVAGILKQESI
jgi:NTP pyrophosphatase (non-canonical NTP hydrolase)